MTILTRTPSEPNNALVDSFRKKLRVYTVDLGEPGKFS